MFSQYPQTPELISWSPAPFPSESIRETWPLSLPRRLRSCSSYPRIRDGSGRGGPSQGRGEQASSAARLRGVGILDPPNGPQPTLQIRGSAEP